MSVKKETFSLFSLLSGGNMLSWVADATPLLLIFVFISIFVFKTGIEALGESFSTFAVPDTEKMKLIIGKWKISDRPYLYEYTNDFVSRIDGFAYYRYKISQFPHNENNIYAIFKSKKTGKAYFCRGNWHRKWGFRYSASRIIFKGKDKFIVYTRANPRKIYFVAKRIKTDEKRKQK
jgi:hypothetical protein